MQFDWPWAFWAITREPNFSQKSNFREIIKKIFPQDHKENYGHLHSSWLNLNELDYFFTKIRLCQFTLKKSEFMLNFKKIMSPFRGEEKKRQNQPTDLSTTWSTSWQHRPFLPTGGGQITLANNSGLATFSRRIEVLWLTGLPFFLSKTSCII